MPASICPEEISAGVTPTSKRAQTKLPHKAQYHSWERGKEGKGERGKGGKGERGKGGKGERGKGGKGERGKGGKGEREKGGKGEGGKWRKGERGKGGNGGNGGKGEIGEPAHRSHHTWFTWLSPMLAREVDPVDRGWRAQLLSSLHQVDKHDCVIWPKKKGQDINISIIIATGSRCGSLLASSARSSCCLV